jgi:pimeloyl-ACP methyl ester carboxylesterase
MLARRDVILADEAFSLIEVGSALAASPVKLIWSHATGFHAAAYGPLLDMLERPLIARGRRAIIVAMDSRGHGETRAARDPSLLKSWQVYYDDLVNLLDVIGKNGKVILAGHSMGATASAFAASKRPGRVSRLVLVEPVFYPPGVGRAPRNKLMAAASRRRSSFASLQEAFDSYRPRAAFQGVSDAWLWSYVNGAFDRSASGAYQLRCTTPWEYRTFATNERWPWGAIARARIPGTILLGEKYSACPPSARAIVKLLRPNWRQIVVPSTTHLLPMEKPQPVVDAIMDAIDDCMADA